MWVVVPKLYYMGCRRDLKYIFVDGGVKRSLNYMVGGDDQKVPSQGWDILISGTALIRILWNTFISILYNIKSLII